NLEYQGQGSQTDTLNILKDYLEDPDRIKSEYLSGMKITCPVLLTISTILFLSTLSICTALLISLCIFRRQRDTVYEW
ncbi:MAG: hypothetical protein MHPSP_001881, partial [Paramarteilia canceri]